MDESLTSQRWLLPWIRIVISAAHMIDDWIFLAAYYRLWRRGKKKKLFEPIICLYLLAFCVAGASLVMTSITISRDPFTENTLFYVSPHAQKYCIKPTLTKGQVHVLIQTLAMSGTLISYLNRHCESETVGLGSRERSSSDRLFSTKGSGTSIRSVPIPRSLSPHPPLPSPLPSPDLSINAS